MCTTLTYSDAGGAIYLGRTMEMDVEESWALAYVPEGQSFESEVPGQQPITYTAKRRFLAVTAPEDPSMSAEQAKLSDLMVLQGLNDAGLTLGVLAYPAGGSGRSTAEMTRAALQATDLGSWILSQFSTVSEVKEGLEKQPVFLTRMEVVVGNAQFPMHIAVHDRSGASIVIEWDKGKEKVYDNPVGVMTNGPQFSWHLTNLNNWTHLTNVDHSSAKFGSLAVTQPDSGIATAALPASNTSAGRFVRALYYSNFAEKVSDPDRAMLALARIMNNFDRPRGATIDLPGVGGEGMRLKGTGQEEGKPETEYTSWTVLSDLNRGHFLIRAYAAFNYTAFDLGRLADVDGVRLLPLAELDPLGGDGTSALVAARTP